MMDDRALVFSAVMSRLVESFGPHFYLAVKYCDEQISKLKAPGLGECDQVIVGVFEKFPRTIPSYETVIVKLREISKANPEEVLHYLATVIKEIVTKGLQNTPFSVLLNVSTVYNPTNREHTLLLKYFSLLFVSDVICQIVTYFGPSGAITFLTHAGYNIASARLPIHDVNVIIVKQWSVIFSILSETDFSAIAQVFGLFSGWLDMTIPFILIRFIRLDSDDTLGLMFVDQVVTVLRQHVRKRTVTNEMLGSIAFFIVSMPYSEDVMQKLYAIVHPLRTDKMLWGGATILLSSIIIRYPKVWRDSEHFMQKRVLKIATDSSKLFISLISYSLFVAGRNLEPNWLFWEWGPNNRAKKLDFVKWNGMFAIQQDDPRSPTQIFMANYFKHSNWAACPRICCHLLVHLMSCDFQYFVKQQLPKFLELSSDDPRLLVLMMAVPSVNEEDFRTLAFKPVPREDIEGFNALLRPKIIQALKSAAAKEVGQAHAVGVGEGDFLVVSLAGEADQNVASTLEDWHVKNFEPMNYAHKHCGQYQKSFTVLGCVLPTLRHVMDKSDFMDEELLSILVSLSSNASSEVSSVAYDIYRNFLPLYLSMSTYIVSLLNSITGNRDPEALFVIVSLLFCIFKQELLEVTPEMLRDVEAVMLVCCASAYPTTRSLCFAILRRINQLLNDKGLLSIIEPQISHMEKMVRTRILLYCEPDRSTDLPAPANRIRFQDALMSHYYDIWVFFVAEIMNTVIASNYVPLLSRMDDGIMRYGDDMKQATSGYLDACLLLMLLDVNFHLPTMRTLSNIEFTDLYEPFKEDRPDNRKNVCNTIHEYLVSGKPYQVKTAFTVIRHLHFSLLPPIIDVLATLDSDYLEQAMSALSFMVKQPEWSKYFFKHNFSRIIAFITMIQFYFVKTGLNGPRVMQWDSDNEENLLKHLDAAKSYCTVVLLTFKVIRNKLSEEQWSLSSREVLFRFLINWTLTKSASLAVLRDSAKDALIVLTGSGHFFNDSLLFDAFAIGFFGQLDLRGPPVLVNLLTYHLDVLLEIFIRACYTQRLVFAERYFDALVDVLETTKCSEIVYPHMGHLLLLGMVFTVFQYSQAKRLFSALGGIIEKENHDIEHVDLSNFSMIPQICSFATEAVFAVFFELLNLKDLHVSLNDIIEGVRPWIKVLRLLPKQKSCAQGVIDCFAYYTPYEFLMNFMKAVESIADESFRSIGSLWVDMFQSPDHRELIPLFVSRWEDQRTKERLFVILLASDPSYSLERLRVRCQFSFYFHLTCCLGRPWNVAKWIGTVMSYAFFRHWDKLSSQISSVIHFAILFRDQHGATMFETFCKKMNVECPDGVLPPDTKRDVVDQFLSKLSEEDHAVWGNEALKWVFGGTDLQLISDSLLVYNRILKPLNDKVAIGVVHTASYVLNNFCGADLKPVTQFILETFIFFSKTLSVNSNLALKYVSCFLDCRVFEENSLKEAIPIFMHALKNPEVFSLKFLDPMSMIRALIPYLETSRQAQTVVNQAEEVLQSDEISMIVAPIKLNHPHMFPRCTSVFTLFYVARKSVLYEALDHYALLSASASRPVLDAIFNISARIISDGVDYANRGALAKLYQSALRSLSRCPSALNFIRVLCEKDPKAATTTVYNFYGWDRSLEDVRRSLSQIMGEDEFPVVTITDCHSFESVMGFRESDTVPKILPFATNTDIINGMSKVAKEKKRKPKCHHRSERSGLGNFGIVNSVSVVFTQEQPHDDGDFRPLQHPTSLIMKHDVFLTKKEERKVTAQEFLSGHRRSSSMLRLPRPPNH